MNYVYFFSPVVFKSLEAGCYESFDVLLRVCWERGSKLARCDLQVYDTFSTYDVIEGDWGGLRAGGEGGDGGRSGWRRGRRLTRVRFRTGDKYWRRWK